MVDYPAAFSLGLFNVLYETSAFLNEVLPRLFRHDLFLSHFFASYPIPQVQSTKGRHCYSFVSELSMEVHSSLFHSEASPTLERVHVGQVLHVLGPELAPELIVAERLSRPERGPADVLHLVVRHVQPLCNRAVGGVLVRAQRGPCAPKSEQQYCFSQLRLMLLGQLRKPAIILHHY